jgi:ribosomal-protein-serine acetyltransferase
MTDVATVHIRPFSEADAEQLCAAVRESFDEISPWMVWCQPDYSIEHAASWIRTTITGRASGSAYEFAVLDARETLAGVCGVNHVNNVDGVANLGYWSRTSLSGRGIAPAAVRAVAAWTFANTDLNRLEIVAAIGNTKSQRVAEKAGAFREAVLRSRMKVGGIATDAVIYSLVRSPKTVPGLTPYSAIRTNS